MRFGGKSALLYLVLSVLLCGLLAGCGGGNEGSGDEPQNGQPAEKAQGGGEKAQGGDAPERPERKIAIGTVKRVKEGKKMTLRPSGTEEQDPKPMAFKIRENADITLGGKEAKPSDIAGGQQAQVEYFVEDEINKATSVKLFKAEGDSSG